MVIDYNDLRSVLTKEKLISLVLLPAFVSSLEFKRRRNDLHL